MRKKERVSVSKTQKINPADARAGIDPTKLAMASTAQRTPTKEEIRQFQVTGRSTAQQERLRATRRSQGSPLQARSDARNVRNDFPDSAKDIPLRPPIDPTTKPPFMSMAPEQQSLGGTAFDPNNALGLQQQSFPQKEEEGQPIKDESFFDRLGQTLKTGEFSDVTGFEREATPQELAQIGAAGLGVGAAAIGGAVVGTGALMTTATTTAIQSVRKISQSGANLLSKPSSLFNSAATKFSRGGLFSRTYIIQGGKTRVVWNSKTISLLQSALRKTIGSKFVAGTAALAIVGSVYGFTQNAVFMRGQVSDDNTDNVGGLQFSQAEFVRNGKETGDFTAALATAEFAEDVYEQIQEQEGILNDFNTVKAGKNNQKSNMFIIAQRKGEILKLQKATEKKAAKLNKQTQQAIQSAERGPPTTEQIKEQNRLRREREEQFK